MHGFYRILKIGSIAAASVLGAVFIVFFLVSNPASMPVVRNFEECRNAGFPVTGTAPRRCEVAEGKYIVEVPLTDCTGIAPSEYPAEELYKGPIASIDFDTYPDALNFRTLMEKGMKEGVNFAGRYNFVSWGCGTSCSEHALVDAKTGHIIVFGLNSSYGADFTKESRLLILNPPRNIPPLLTAEEEKTLSTEYYSFDNSGFVRVCAAPAKRAE